ncbi:MAG: hypothetical protein AMS16_03045 [Planctomycetes bacterium DG_58]|nr:MAG: hypothetical protein AMS16_03045 [Planctomycetes bacterium DG_58]KPL02118.1 MAG: hypothetical protein AMK75_03270 [Planctomycetes bacterium SM23_65]
MMIEVNLLPAELRRIERTPLPRFLVIIIGTAAIMATGAFGVVVNLRNIPDRRAREAALVEDVGRSTVQAAVYDRLIDQIAETKDRKKAIAEVWRQRILWSEKLAQVAEMTPKFIGIQGMRLEEAREGARRGKEEGGLLTVSSICAGADQKRVANWRRIVMGDYPVKGSRDPWVGKNFFTSFEELLPTATQKMEVQDYVEKEALKFGLKLPVKPPSVRLAEAIQAAREDRRHQIQRGAPGASTGRTTPKAAKPQEAKADAPRPNDPPTPLSPAEPIQSPTPLTPEKTAPAVHGTLPPEEAEPEEETPKTTAKEEQEPQKDEAVAEAPVLEELPDAPTETGAPAKKDEGETTPEEMTPKATKPQETTGTEAEKEAENEK